MEIRIDHSYCGNTESHGDGCTRSDRPRMAPGRGPVRSLATVHLVAHLAARPVQLNGKGHGDGVAGSQRWPRWLGVSARRLGWEGAQHGKDEMRSTLRGYSNTNTHWRGVGGERRQSGGVRQ
jgi:hypothetical protein